MTEAGIMPTDWVVADLASVSDCLDNLRVPLNSAQRADMVGDVPYCGANGILGYVSDYVIDDDIILMAEDGGYFDEFSTRPIAYRMSGKCWVNNHAHILKAKPQFSQGYLFYSLVHKDIRRFLASGTRAKLNRSELNKILIAAPPTKYEQETIAKALSDADALIGSLESLIAKKRAIKQGAMLELLSGQQRLPGFSGEWKEEPFGKIFDFLPTATNSRGDLAEDGEAAYVHYGDIHTRFHDHLDFGQAQIPRIERSRCKNAALLKNGDWIMADASEDFDGVGKSVEVSGLAADELAVSGLHTFLLREKQPTFAPGFKGHLGNARRLREQYLRVMTGMKVFGVSKGALRDLVIPIPEWKEQAAICSVLNDMSSELTAMEDRLAKARQIKQGMMQDLLTGKVRLV